MNDHVPDSSGLPLRAMVMVLLFLGVIFLLVGFQAMSSGGSEDDSSTSSVMSATSSTTAATSSKPAPPKSALRVYNISEQEGIAARTADQLREAGWEVTETGNLVLLDVTATTVFYTPDVPGEKESAEAVGELLNAPAQPRIPDPDIADQPPGVIVVVAG